MKIEKIHIPPSPQESRASGAVGADHIKDSDGESDRHGGNAAYYGRNKKQGKEEDAVVFKKHEEEVEVAKNVICISFDLI